MIARYVAIKAEECAGKGGGAHLDGTREDAWMNRTNGYRMEIKWICLVTLLYD